jgi:predicted ATP-dependent endonuclease of OLD family
MQLIIKNFGPLKKGEIDLSKKFYVFVGDNNTGKTYLSQLLWCIFSEETIEQFATTVEIEPLPMAENRCFEITPALLDTILNKFARFLTDDIIPKQFNVESKTLILENLVLKFQYHLNQIRMRTLNAVYGTPIDG